MNSVIIGHSQTIIKDSDTFIKDSEVLQLIGRVLGKVFDSSKVYALQLVKSMLNLKELEPPRRVAFVEQKLVYHLRSPES